MKDLLEPVHISLERRSLATARTVKEWGLAVAAIVLVIALLPIAWFSWTQIPFWAKGARLIIAHADKLAGEASTAMDKSRQASEETLKRTQELKATISTATGTLDEATQAIAQLKETTKQIGDSTALTLDASTKTIGILGDEIAAVSGATQASLSGLVPMTQAGTQTFTAATALLADPDLLGSINNLNRITKDSADKFHALLYPPKPTGRFRYVKTAWSIIKVPLSLAEPAYYGVELIKGK